jgi:hypothetical protein
MQNLFLKLILLLLCFGGFQLSAQSKKEIRNAKVKSLTETITNFENGKEIVITDNIQKFDKNGNVIDEMKYDKAGKLESRIITKYNSEKDKLEETILDEKGKQIERITYKYDTEGDKKEEIHYGPNNELVVKMVYNVNLKGLKTERKSFDAKGKLVQIKKYNYTF